MNAMMTFWVMLSSRMGNNVKLVRWQARSFQPVIMTHTVFPSHDYDLPSWDVVAGGFFFFQFDRAHVKMYESQLEYFTTTTTSCLSLSWFPVFLLASFLSVFAGEVAGYVMLTEMKKKECWSKFHTMIQPILLYHFVPALSESHLS